MSQASEAGHTPLTVRLDWTSYLLVAILFGPVAVIVLLATAKHPAVWPWLAIALVLLVSVLIWLRAFRVEVSADRLIVRTLWSVQQVPLSSIGRMSMDVGWSRRGGGLFRLAVGDHGGRELLTVNMKPFSKHDLVRIVQAITAISPSVEMDEVIRELSQGQLGALNRTVMQAAWEVVLWLLAAGIFLGVVHGLLRLHGILH